MDRATTTPPDAVDPGISRPPARAALTPGVWVWVAVGAVTVAAAVLRLRGLGGVPEDPFYDAAVRSMSSSWHNFFFGAYEPGGSVSIDKPPLDLWLQVVSVKLLGFTPTALKLPEALAGTAAVPLLFIATRRTFGVAAALMGAAVLAVLPVSVLTARSDTMDAVMMSLTIGALVLVLHAVRTGRVRWLYLGGAVVGLAFNVKLFEALIALPALAIAAWLGLGRTRRWRAAHLAGAGGLLAAVALSWLLATLAVPRSERPFAIGSTNGSAWNAAFVFNGYDRITRPAREAQNHPLPPGQAGQAPPPRIPRRTRRRPSPHTTSLAALDHLAIAPPSPTRLLDRTGPLSGRRLGFVLLAALLLGLPALGASLRRGPGREPAGGAWAVDPTAAPAHRRAAAGSVGLWLLTGTVLFSAMTRLHPRYVEAFTPAVAAAAGIGLVWALREVMTGVGLSPRGRPSESPGRSRLLWPAAALALTLIALAIHARYLYGQTSAVVLVTLLSAGASLLTLAVSLLGHRFGGSTLSPWAGAAGALAVVAVLGVPADESLSIVRSHASDAGHVGFMRPDQVRRLSGYLRAHQAAASYEVAATSATQAASLIVRDARPVLVLTTYDGLTVVPVARLAQLAAAGRVRYALLGGTCRADSPPTVPQCSPPGRWIRAHGVDVSADAGLGRRSLLWRLPGR